MVDTGSTYQLVQRAVAVELGRLIQESFTLRLERQYITQRPRSIIDLNAELTNTVDDTLDTFILNNELNGDEILELPRGRKMTYVV